MRNIDETCFTRREWLRLGGRIGTGFLLSPVIALRSYAQTGKIPPRVIFVFSHNGVPMSAWNMSEGADGLTLAGAYAPLNRHRAQVNAIEGLDLKHGGGHVGGSLTFLTNQRSLNETNPRTRAQGESIDHFLARHYKSDKKAGANALLTTTAGGDQWGGGEFLTYEGPNRPIKAISNQRTLFEKVFAGGATAPRPAPGPALPPDWQARSRQSVLDFVQEEYRQLKAALGPAESRKLDETLTSIRELELDLIVQARSPRTEPATACSPGQPPSPNLEVEAFDKITRVVVEAMACGETLVATIRFSNGLYHNAKVHEWSHNEPVTNPGSNQYKHTQWQAEQVAILMDRLKAKSMASGSLLDHSLIVWGNEIGIMRWPNHHGGDKQPFILGGSCGGRMNTGRLIKTSGQHSAVLVSVAQGVGHAVDGFGDMSGCKPGPVAGLMKG